MNEQIPLNFNPKPEREGLSEEAAREITLNYPENLVREKYKELVGQFPEGELSDDEIVRALIDPEGERGRLMQKHRDEDHDDVTRTNRGTPK